MKKSSQHQDITKKKILYNIMSILSERAATEIKFKASRKELIPKFNLLSIAEQEIGLELNALSEGMLLEI